MKRIINEYQMLKTNFYVQGKNKKSMIRIIFAVMMTFIVFWAAGCREIPWHRNGCGSQFPGSVEVNEIWKQ